MKRLVFVVKYLHFEHFFTTYQKKNMDRVSYEVCVFSSVKHQCNSLANTVTQVNTFVLVVLKVIPYQEVVFII